MKVILSTAAKDDLAAIGDYISVDNPLRADSFVAELVDCCSSLADIPRAFPLVPRYERHGIRRRSHGRYAIFYRVIGDAVEIIHIIHGARDHERLLSADE